MPNSMEIIYQGIGRRKSSVAQVVLIPGNGKIIVNNLKALEFFPYATLVQDLKQPLDVTETLDKFDIKVKVKGGGFTGQAGATRLAIARALLKVSIEFKSALKHAGLLTCDSRVKERKKYGLKAARKAPQYSKR